MMFVPSISLIEIAILAVVAGLPLLVGGFVLAIVAKRRRERRTGAAPQSGSDDESTKSSFPGKWLLLLGLTALLALPLVPLAVVATGFLFVTPVRSVRTAQEGPAPQVQVVAMATPVETPLVVTPAPTPWPTSESDTGSVESPPPEPSLLSIAPDDDLLFVTLPGIAALAVLVGVVIFAITLKRWSGNDPRSRAAGETKRRKGSKLTIALVALAALAVLTIFVNLALDFSVWIFIWSVVIFAACSILVGLLLLVPRLRQRWQGRAPQLGDQGTVDDEGDDWVRTARLRYALLAITIWFALSIYLILDVGFAVSVYLQVTAIYAAFWVLIGALLLVGSPGRQKLLALGLLVIVLVSIRFVDWNSRKPFLKDLYRIQEGMTVEQVEQIMGQYMGGACWPTHPLGSVEEPVSGTEEPARPGRMVYRHTNEGWGDSDWGEILFEDGQVVEVQFLPD